MPGATTVGPSVIRTSWSNTRGDFGKSAAGHSDLKGADPCHAGLPAYDKKAGSGTAHFILGGQLPCQPHLTPGRLEHETRVGDG